jgi:hypothetical protein
VTTPNCGIISLVSFVQECVGRSRGIHELSRACISTLITRCAAPKRRTFQQRSFVIGASALPLQSWRRLLRPASDTCFSFRRLREAELLDHVVVDFHYSFPWADPWKRGRWLPLGYRNHQFDCSASIECGSAWLLTPDRRPRLALTQFWCSSYSAPISLA